MFRIELNMQVANDFLAAKTRRGFHPHVCVSASGLVEDGTPPWLETRCERPRAVEAIAHGRVRKEGHGYRQVLLTGREDAW